MSRLSDAADSYLRLRRALGHDLADAARLLPRFVAYMDANGEETITVHAAVDWAQLPDAEPGSTVWPRRMTAVRGFARYMAGIDPDTEVPPTGLIPYRQRWKPPHIYSDADIAALLTAARGLRGPLRAATYTTLIGLLAATGLRIGEAIRLDRTDIDDDQGVLQIRQSKFGKTRLVPLHPTAVDALQAYARVRDNAHPHAGSPAVFLSDRQTRLCYQVVSGSFRWLVNEAGIRSSTPRSPRLHDLRHTFAVATLRSWHHDGHDVHTRLPWLATYLGHRDPRSTYWYLSAAPELLALAAERLERLDGSDDR